MKRRYRIENAKRHDDQIKHVLVRVLPRVLRFSENLLNICRRAAKKRGAEIKAKSSCYFRRCGGGEDTSYILARHHVVDREAEAFVIMANDELVLSARFVTKPTRFDNREWQA